jgi:adenine-specific DNA-methyltransferase
MEKYIPSRMVDAGFIIKKKWKKKLKTTIFGLEKMGMVYTDKMFPKEDSYLVTPETIWFGEDVGTTNSAKKHSLKLFKDQIVFDTPKPEQLIKRILDIATVENDLVLDTFLGSGTTCAVAHKMKRKYIGIEKEEKTIGYIIERLNKVIEGESGGISKDVHWKFGGHFSYYIMK